MSHSPQVEKLAFTRDQAAKLAHISEDQLSRWSGDVFSPTYNTGLFSFVDLVALRTLSTLRHQFGISVQELRRASKYMREKSELPWSRLKIGVGPRRKHATSSQLYFWDPEHERWYSADAAGQQITPVALDKVEEHLRKLVSRVGSRRISQRGRFEATRGVCGGKERFAGTRILVEQVLVLVRQGRSNPEILRTFPTLAEADVEAAREKLRAA